MKTQYIALGAAATFLLLSRKKPVSPVKLAQRASATAITLSTQPGGALLSAENQLRTVKSLLRNEKLPAPSPKVSGVPPFGVSQNLPSPEQVMILYSIDPNFTITEAGQPALRISDLYDLESLQSPTLANEIVNATPRQKVANALKLLPESRTVEFMLQLLANAAPLYAEIGKFKEYAAYVRYLARKATGASVRAPAGNKKFLDSLSVRSNMMGAPGSELKDLLLYANGTVDFHLAKGQYGPATIPLADVIRSRALLPYHSVIQDYERALTEEERQRLNQLDGEVVELADGTREFQFNPTAEKRALERRAEQAYLRDADEAFQLILKALK